MLRFGSSFALSTDILVLHQHPGFRLVQDLHCALDAHAAKEAEGPFGPIFMLITGG